ncbi:MAG: TlpA family protein disulfide reductase [Planctomycetota bacterium]
MKRLGNEPFALIGVNSDRDRLYLKERMKSEGITWRSFWSGPLGTSGPIPARWGVRRWPTIYIIDHEGVFRFIGPRGKNMDQAVDSLLARIDR